MEHSQPDAGQMIDLVVSFFRERDEHVGVENMMLEREDGSRIALASLFQALALSPPERWQAKIEAHFAALDAAPGVPATWEEAAGHVRLRLMSTGDAASPVSWDVEEGLRAVLMLETEGAGTPVGEETLAQWAIKPEMAFDRALRNTIDAETVTEDHVRGSGGGSFERIQGGDYTTAHLLVLDQHWDSAPHGAVAAVPNRNVVLYHAVRDSSVVASLEAMATRASELYREGPGPISPHVFWWQPTGLTRLDVAVDERGAHFRPGADFAAVVEGLPDADDERDHGWFRKRR